MKELYIVPIPEGKVYVNEKRLKEEKSKRKKFKLKKVAVILTLVAALTAAGIFGYKAVEPKLNREPISPVPQDKVEIMIPVEVGFGDTLSGFEELFFNEDTAERYKNIANYRQAVIDKNDLHYKGPDNVLLERGKTYEFPFILDENNPNYRKKCELEAAIEEIEKNKKWVSHEVEKGETLSYLASLSAIGETDTYNKLAEILKKNGLKPTTPIHEGDVILIINHELKELYEQLNKINKIIYAEARNETYNYNPDAIKM